MELCEQCSYKRRKKGRKLCGKCISQNRREKHTVKYIYWDLKWSAKRRQIEFKITLKQFEKWIQAEDGQRYLKGRGRDMDDFTIDRKIEEGPYTIKGIQVITKRENIAKFNKYYSDKQKSHYDWSDCPF